MSPRLVIVTGAGLLPHLDALAALRTEIFRDWPYLYDGDRAEEARYLRHYAEDSEAAMVLAMDGGEVVGAATCQPMAHTHGAVREAWAAAGRDAARTCYLGESVLRAAYRGRGLGVGFFTAREAHARALGLSEAAFCAVVRNPQDPRRPAGYVPLDGFWQRRGYAHHPGLSCVLSWKEVGDDRETPHSLSFWIRALA